MLLSINMKKIMQMEVLIFTILMSHILHSGLSSTSTKYSVAAMVTLQTTYKNSVGVTTHQVTHLRWPYLELLTLERDRERRLRERWITIYCWYSNFGKLMNWVKWIKFSNMQKQVNLVNSLYSIYLHISWSVYFSLTVIKEFLCPSKTLNLIVVV